MVVVLGVLAAIVVFAVRGSGDKGRQAAFRADARTLRTAQEAYCAQRGTYATDDAELVRAGLLSEVGSVNHTRGTPSGPCGGTGFVITCAPTHPQCGEEGTTPDSNVDGAAPLGGWTRVGDLPAPSLVNGSMVTMSNGKVLHFGRASTAAPPAVADAATGYLPGPVAVFDPSGRTWSPAPTVPTPPHYPNHPNYNPITTTQMVSLTGGPAECGGNCGKVLVAAAVGQTGQVRSIGPDHLNQQFFLFDPAAFDAGDDPWARLPDPPSAAVIGHGAALVQIAACSRAGASDCGKVMVTGGLDNNGTNPQAGGSWDPARIRVSLWDPTVEPPSPASWSVTDGTARFVSATSTTGSAVVTSPDAGFTANDVNKRMVFVPGFTGASRIQTVVDATTVVLDAMSAAGGTTDPSTPAWVGADLLTVQTASISGGRIHLATQDDSMVYDPSTRLWTPSTNRQADFTYTCPSTGASVVRRHQAVFGNSVVLADGRVLSPASGAGSGTGGNDTCNVVGSGAPPPNSTVFDPGNPLAPWALAPGVCPCLGQRAPGTITLPPWFGSKVLMVYAVGANSARTVTDGVTVGTGTDEERRVVTSATADFTAGDVGRAITGDGIPPGATVSSVTDATTVVISPPAGATVSATGVTLKLGNGWATSALFDGSGWTSIDASSAPTPRLVDSAGVPLAGSGPGMSSGYPVRPATAMLPTGQVLLAGGNQCEAAGGACGGASVFHGQVDTWMYTPGG